MERGGEEVGREGWKNNQMSEKKMRDKGRQKVDGDRWVRDTSRLLCERGPYRFLMILCTMSSVVKPLPLSTVRKIPLFLGSWDTHNNMQSHKKTDNHTRILQNRQTHSQYSQHKGLQCPCQETPLSSHDTPGPPTTSDIIIGSII